MRGVRHCGARAAIVATLLASLGSSTACVTADRYESLAAQQQAMAAEREELRQMLRTLEEKLEQVRKSRDALAEQMARTQLEVQALRDRCAGCASNPH